MRKFKVLGCFLFAALLVLGGCSNNGNEKEATNKKKEKQTEKVENTQPSEEVVSKAEKPEETDEEFRQYFTEDPEEMVQLEPGPYSGDKYDLEAIKKEMDQFPKGETPDDYYYRLVSLVAEDYRFFYEAMQDVDTDYEDPTAHPDGELGTPPEATSKQINVQILFDASGSMRAEIGGKTRMALAKEAVNDFVKELPEEVNVSLRVYGHKGTGSDADKELSCSSSEVVYPLGSFEQKKFSKALDQFDPAGWTPLAASIEAAMDDLKGETGENVENIIYVVSDGVETCDGDPVKAAEKLNQSDIQAIVNIIGFDVDDAGQKALKKVAKAGKGEYATVRSQQDFQKFFEQEKQNLREEWQKWSNENTSHYAQSQNERVNELFEIENKARDLTKIEEEHLRELVAYWNETLSEEESKQRILTIQAGKRGRALRSYAFQTAVAYRDQLRSKGLKARDDVRDKAREEREQLKEK
ncbi:VWA domain-containing protein [Lederbergia sp. NSJ-179]|uniref:vWA domain-containing protein n=1 Tax=Lederbergia sp. NSJ-179 TaxID=2931402 RepID=UPI001FCFF7FA|nr:VWA domain-containing protein [Lederbergia sp. NSJ-179]MCJ7843608.1 VWA domain-containing protein [Lederbergia sp. NSJ-179]